MMIMNSKVPAKEMVDKVSTSFYFYVAAKSMHKDGLGVLKEARITLQDLQSVVIQICKDYKIKASDFGFTLEELIREFKDNKIIVL